MSMTKTDEELRQDTLLAEEEAAAQAELIANAIKASQFGRFFAFSVGLGINMKESMMHEFYRTIDNRAYYWTKWWRALSVECRAVGSCKWCKREFNEHDLVAHHISYDHKGTAEEKSDIVPLCGMCHKFVERTKDRAVVKFGATVDSCNEYELICFARDELRPFVVEELSKYISYLRKDLGFKGQTTKQCNDVWKSVVCRLNLKRDIIKNDPPIDHLVKVLMEQSNVG